MWKSLPFSAWKSLPKLSGIYVIMSGSDIIYVGTSLVLRKRFENINHRRKFEDHFATDIVFFQMWLVEEDKAVERFNIEAAIIRALKPKLNVVHVLPKKETSVVQ